MNSLQLQFIRGWKAFSEIHRIQDGLFRCGYVKTVDVRESKKERMGDS